MIIDSHQHFWKYDSEKLAWINDDMQVLRQDFMPNDLASILQSNNIDGCIAVQADQSETETKFLFDLASRYNFIKGVIGWLDLCSENIEQRLQLYTKNRLLKGLRHIVQDEPDDAFMLREDFQRGIALLEKYHLTYDILIYPKQLSAALQLVDCFPNQPFVVDHIAKPSIQDEIDDNWSQYIKALGAHKNVFCKISGMVTETIWGKWSKSDFIPFLDVVFNAFGPDRIMFGSDWPVCLLSGKYEEVIDVVISYIAQFDIATQKKILGRNATSFYNLSM